MDQQLIAESAYCLIVLSSSCLAQIATPDIGRLPSGGCTCPANILLKDIS